MADQDTKTTPHATTEATTVDTVHATTREHAGERDRTDRTGQPAGSAGPARGVNDPFGSTEVDAGANRPHDRRRG